MQTPTLTTERLLLRPWTPEDLPDILQIFGDEETNHFLPWYPLKTMEEAAAFFAERLTPQADGGLHAALCLRESGEIIGYLNVSSEPACDLGYGLLGSHRGKGYVTEAALAVLDHLTAQGLPYVTTTHDVENPKSGAVMQRLGMDYQYSYLEHWQPKNIPVVFRLYLKSLDGREHPFPLYWEQSQIHFVEGL